MGVVVGCHIHKGAPVVKAVITDINKILDALENLFRSQIIFGDKAFHPPLDAIDAFQHKGQLARSVAAGDRTLNLFVGRIAGQLIGGQLIKRIDDHPAEIGA